MVAHPALEGLKWQRFLSFMRPLTFFFLMLLAGTLSARDLATHPVFKHYVGSWKAAGELTGEQNKTITVSEEWKGQAEGENTFVITGSRTMNGDTQPFTWTFTYNEGADTFDAVLTGGEGANPLRFEAHPSEVSMTLELKAVTGGGESAITVVESFPEGVRDKFETKVVFTNESGQTTLQGSLQNERLPTP